MGISVVRLSREERRKGSPSQPPNLASLPSKTKGSASAKFPIPAPAFISSGEQLAASGVEELSFNAWRPSRVSRPMRAKGLRGAHHRIHISGIRDLDFSFHLPHSPCTFDANLLNHHTIRSASLVHFWLPVIVLGIIRAISFLQSRSRTSCEFIALLSTLLAFCSFAASRCFAGIPIHLDTPPTTQASR